MSRQAYQLNPYVKGLLDAEQKGRAAAEDPEFKESDNPYKRWEHRTSWRDGFRHQRQVQTTTVTPAKAGAQLPESK